MELGTLGIWSMQLRGADRPAVRDAAAELDALGFRTLWIPGLDGQGVFDDMSALLGAAPHSVVALGVLGVWGQRPSDVGQRMADLDATTVRAHCSAGRQQPESAEAAGEQWGSPIATMSEYLDRLAASDHPVTRDRLVLGALGPRMARLAATRGAGLHPFLVPPEYSWIQREALGPEALIARISRWSSTRTRPAHAMSPGTAWVSSRSPAYRANLTRLGFGDNDLVPGGSDRLMMRSSRVATSPTLRSGCSSTSTQARITSPCMC